jgi:hypothetical protein
MRGDIQLEEIDTTAFTDRYGNKAMNVTVPNPKAAAAR